MFEEQFANVRYQFAAQFEEDGEGYLYRKNRRGAPIRVTAAERNRYVESYNRKLRILVRSFAAGTLIIIAASGGYSLTADVEFQQSWIYVGAGFLLGVYLLAMRQINNAPAADLERRVPAGRVRSSSELRRLHLSELSWGRMAAILGVIVVSVLANLPNYGEPISARHWMYLGIGGFSLLAGLGAVIFKLRMRG